MPFSNAWTTGICSTIKEHAWLVELFLSESKLFIIKEVLLVEKRNHSDIHYFSNIFDVIGSKPIGL